MDSSNNEIKKNEIEKDEIEKDEKLIVPMIPLRGIVVFPKMVIHFDVGREKSINALEESMAEDQMILLSAQLNPETNIPTKDDFHQIGTLAKIKQILKMPGDALRVLVEGVSRAEIKEVVEEEPYFTCHIEPLEEQTFEEIPETVEALVRLSISRFEEYVLVSGKVNRETLSNLMELEDPSEIADAIASNLDIRTEYKQEILETLDLKTRLTRLTEILTKEIDILKIERDLAVKTKSQINKGQKEYYLREQMRVIQEELGQEENLEDEIEDYKKKLKKLKLSKETHEKIEKEINRLSKIPAYSAEGGVIRTYIEWVLELPWNKSTKDIIDLKLGKKILDEDHYGLEKVKERVLEYLAIKKLTKDMKGPILCLVGPPGVGKTSIATSIARALNRKFVRMSLGGVRDEAEIRGHRRTYIGAIPGRIISSIKEANSNNPLFLFDEIDKTGNDFRGDPASALLEVLDPEQNRDFKDHYLDVPFDLSKVMFLTTANTIDTIPRPLLDRMEIISIPGYIEEEKLHITLKYLVPKQMKAHGLKETQLSISEKAIRDTINYYTRESGVRNLEREIAHICRKSAKLIVEGKTKKIKVSASNLEKFLGKKKVTYDNIKEQNEIGITTGLAWTSVGGDILFIETNVMKGKGGLSLTGQLGDVMQESAKAGYSYIRSRCIELGISETFYEDKDIHIHIPEGATPKDGPSAGVTMCLAMISALTNKPVRRDVAMTGEITLRGKVLPVGGIREKVLAAHRAGIKTILLPEENVKDLDEIPATVRKQLKFVPIKDMEQVIEHGFAE